MMGPNDFAPRVTFCRWLLELIVQVPDFLRFIFFSDECAFTKDGILNSRNSHVWAQENPNAKHMRSQHHFAVNVWAGIISDHLIGPYLLPLPLSGDIYLLFIQEILPELLEVVPLEVRREMWFQHISLMSVSIWIKPLATDGLDVEAQ
jgi:hypothetical protein